MTKDSKLDELDDEELIEYLESRSQEDLVADETTPTEELDIYVKWNQARENKDFQSADKYRNMLIEWKIL